MLTEVFKIPELPITAQGGEPSYTAKPLEAFGLGGVDCKVCGNSGTITRKDDNGVLYTRECDCMARRRSLRRIRRSRMGDLLARYRFETYEANRPQQKEILRKAKQFAAADRGWFYIAGQSGSGKSHICTAICNALIERNTDVIYMPWRDAAVQLKANVTEPDQYRKWMNRLKRAPVLYIDDFLKGGAGEADLRLAFEIINYRYNDTRLRTILSSETEMKTLLELDEALASRICERARGYVLTAPKENRRTK